MPAEPADLSPDDAALPGPDRPEQTTWAGNRSLDTRWWWSPALMIVVGVVVIAYQFGAILGEGGIVLNWVMVAIGAAVAGVGIVSLKRDYDIHRAAEASGADRPSSSSDSSS